MAGSMQNSNPVSVEFDLLLVGKRIVVDVLGAGFAQNGLIAGGVVEMGMGVDNIREI